MMEEMQAKKWKGLKGGINLRTAPWDEVMETRQQSVMMQNLYHKFEVMESIPGSVKYQGTSLGSGKITALMPYYDDQKDDSYRLLCAFEGGIYIRDPQANEWTLIKDGLVPNSVYTSVLRNGVMYISSTNDGLMKYLGGTKIETIGTGDTKPGSFRVCVYMKEVDRLFGISDNAILGQISWCDFSDPETWFGDSVNRMKLAQGERTEGGETLFGKLIIFNTYSIWIYYVSGNEENWRLEQAPTTVGCVAPNTIKRVGREIWFLGESPTNVLGVYAFNGSTCRLLTDDVHPLFRRINPNKKRQACAEVHDELYSISFALDASETNNISLDLDILNVKDDQTPAIYGPHTTYWYSSCVLDGRINQKEWLMGDEVDGFVYKSGGMTWKGANNNDGQLLQHHWIGRTHNDGAPNLIKQYPNVYLYFRPRGYFDLTFTYKLSYGNYGFTPDIFNPNVQQAGWGGGYNIYPIGDGAMHRVLGTPEMYQYQSMLGVYSKGTAIQFEIINNNGAQRIAIEGYDYDVDAVHEQRKIDYLP